MARLAGGFDSSRFERSCAHRSGVRPSRDWTAGLESGARAGLVLAGLFNRHRDLDYGSGQVSLGRAGRKPEADRMRWLRYISSGILAAVFFASLFAGALAPAPYAKQFRDEPDA